MPRKKIIKKCSVDGCEKMSRSRGWCITHYNRWLVHKDPLKKLKNSPGEGNISRGFKRVSVDGKCVREHRHIAEQMLGRSLNINEVVHHLNGNKLDNRPENLAVLSQSEHVKLHWEQGDCCGPGRNKWYNFFNPS